MRQIILGIVAMTASLPVYLQISQAPPTALVEVHSTVTGACEKSYIAILRCEIRRSHVPEDVLSYNYIAGQVPATALKENDLPRTI